MKEYLVYAYYDDNFNLIGVFKEDTPKDILEKAKQKYYSVRTNEFNFKD